MMTFKKKYDQLLSKSISDHIVECRHHLHHYPELSLKEFKTTAFLKKECLKLNNIDLETLNPTGLIGTIKGSQPHLPPIALRADIDALPIQEETTCSFKSIHPNIMHACGHDVHTSWLLATLYLLNHYPPKQDVIFIFQPAEEISEGAKIVLNTGRLKHCHAIYGGHVDLNYPIGQFVVHDGYISANSTTFSITLKGKSSHIARPHQGVSPLPALSDMIHTISTLATTMQNKQSPALVGIGTIQCGTAINISPETATITGSIRSFTSKTEETILKTLKKALKTIETTYKISTTLDSTQKSPAIKNNKKTNTIATQAIEKEFGKSALKMLKSPNLGSEDFGFYSTQIPATFIRVGSRQKNQSILPAHNPKFFVDDDVIFLGALAFFRLCS